MEAMFSPKLEDVFYAITDSCLSCGEHVQHNSTVHVFPSGHCIMDGCQCDTFRPPARGPRFDDLTPDQDAMLDLMRRRLAAEPFLLALAAEMEAQCD